MNRFFNIAMQSVPFGVVENNLGPLDNHPFDILLEHHLHLPTFPEPTLNLPHQLAFVNQHFLANKILKVGLLVKQLLHYYRVVIHQPIHRSSLRLLLEQFDVLVALIVYHLLDGSEKGYPAGFFVVIDIGFVTDHFETYMRVEFFLECQNCEYFGLFVLLRLLHHLLVDLSDCQIRLPCFQHLPLIVKQPQLPFNSLMTRHNIEFGLVFDCPLVQSYHMQIYHKFSASLQISRGAAYPPFNLFGIQMLHQHGYPVALPGHLHRFPEHLHRFYFVFLLQLTQLYLLPGFDPTLHNRPSYDRSLALDLKTMVDQV